MYVKKKNKNKTDKLCKLYNSNFFFTFLFCINSVLIIDIIIIIQLVVISKWYTDIKIYRSINKTDISSGIKLTLLEHPQWVGQMLNVKVIWHLGPKYAQQLDG